MKTEKFKNLENWLQEIRKKVSEAIRYDERRNQDKCFIVALRKITCIFGRFYYDYIFKLFELKEQLRLANFFLKCIRMCISLKNCTEEKPINYVKSCKGKGILVFWQDNEDVHTEAYLDGNFIEPIEEEVKHMLRRKMNIREFRLEQGLNTKKKNNSKIYLFAVKF